jgi:hypothetical protein
MDNACNRIIIRQHRERIRTIRNILNGRVDTENEIHIYSPKETSIIQSMRKAVTRAYPICITSDLRSFLNIDYVNWFPSRMRTIVMPSGNIERTNVGTLHGVVFDSDGTEEPMYLFKRIELMKKMVNGTGGSIYEAVIVGYRSSESLDKPIDIPCIVKVSGLMYDKEWSAIMRGGYLDEERTDENCIEEIKDLHSALTSHNSPTVIEGICLFIGSIMNRTNRSPFYTVAYYQERCFSKGFLQSQLEQEDEYIVQVIAMKKLEDTLKSFLYRNKNSLTCRDLIAIAVQIVLGIAIGYNTLGLVHNDLHVNNIMYEKTMDSHIYYRYIHETFKSVHYFAVPVVRGCLFKQIDFERARIEIGSHVFVSDYLYQVDQEWKPYRIQNDTTAVFNGIYSIMKHVIVSKKDPDSELLLDMIDRATGCVLDKNYAKFRYLREGQKTLFPDTRTKLYIKNDDLTSIIRNNIPFHMYGNQFSASLYDRIIQEVSNIDICCERLVCPGITPNEFINEYMIKNKLFMVSYKEIPEHAILYDITPLNKFNLSMLSSSYKEEDY